MSDVITPDELERMMSGQTPPRLLDVRRKADIQDDPAMIPGAEWKDPEAVDTWGNELGEKEVVIYCVRGGSVSKSTQEKLREYAIKARYIEGGIEAWKKSGKPVSGG